MVGIDQLFNAILAGDPGDTISYRAAVAMLKGQKWGCVLCQILNKIQHDHCEKTLASTDHQRLLWGSAVKDGEHPL